MSQQDIAGIDLLHSRMFSNKTYIDLEISVDRDKSLWEAHEAAEHYGIKVTKNGMVCCPFHRDRHPSMKLENNPIVCRAQ